MVGEEQDAGTDLLPDPIDSHQGLLRMRIVELFDLIKDVALLDRIDEIGGPESHSQGA